MTPHLEMAKAIGERDGDRLARSLTADVRVRALLPAELVELTGRDEFVAQWDRWLESFESVELADTACETVGDRILVTYRLEVGRGEQRWTVVQSAVCATLDSQVSAVDLVCSGFRRV